MYVDNALKVNNKKKTLGNSIFTSYADCSGSRLWLILIMLVPFVAHAIAVYFFMLSSLMFNLASIATRTFVDDLRHGQVRGLLMCVSSLRFNSVFG
jgi:hypothetical protein